MADGHSEVGGDALSSVMGVHQRLGMNESVWERHYRGLRDGMMEIVFRATRDARSQFPSYALFRLVQTVQLLSFAFNAAAAFPWREAPVRWLMSAASYANFAQRVTGGPATETDTMRRTVDALAITVVATAGLGVFSVWCTRRTSPSIAAMPLRLIYLWLAVGEPLLLIPAATVFGAALRCSDSDVPAQLAPACAAIGVPRTVLVVVALLLLLLGSVVKALTFFPRSLVSDSMRARAHGRVHAVEALLMASVALVFGAAQGGATDSALLAAVLAVATITLLAAFVIYQPYYAARVNRLTAALHAVAAWGAISLLVCVVEDDPAHSSASMAFLLGALPTAGCAALMVDWWARRLDATPRSRLDSPLLLELKMRPLALRLADSAQRKEKSSHAGLYAYSAVAVETNDETNDESGGGGGGGGGDGDESGEEDWMELERAYQGMLEKRLNDALVSMFLVVVYTDLANNANMALLAGNRAQAASPALDVRYYLFARQRVNADASRSGGPSAPGGSESGTMDPVAFIAYEHHMERAKQATHRARLALVRFWQHLDEEVPDLARISDLGAGLYSHVRSAQAAYRRVLSVNSESPSALRQYATFLVEVLNNTKEASDLLQQADEIEEARAKEHQRDAAARGKLDLSMATVQRGDNVDLYDDNNGIVTLSTEPQNLGEMLAVNSSFARFLGYKRSQLLNRDINIVVPPPFSYYHADMLRRYMRTRQGIFMNNTRPAFCMDSKGYLRGFLLTLRESTDLDASALTALQTVGALQDDDVQRKSSSAGGEGAGDLTASTPGMKVVGVIQPLDQPDLDVAWIDTDGQITACTRHLPVVFHFEMQAMHDGRVSINDCIPGCWNAAEHEFHSNQFTYLRYNARTRRVFAVPCEVVKMAVTEVTVFLIQLKFRDRDVTSATNIRAQHIDRNIPQDWLRSHMAGGQASEAPSLDHDAESRAYTHDTSQASARGTPNVSGPPSREQPAPRTSRGATDGPQHPEERRVSSADNLLGSPAPDELQGQQGSVDMAMGGALGGSDSDSDSDDALIGGGDERKEGASRATSAQRTERSQSYRARQSAHTPEVEEKLATVTESEPLIMDKAHHEPAIVSQPLIQPADAPLPDDAHSQSSSRSDAHSSSTAATRMRSLHAAVERRNSKTDSTLVNLRRLLLGVLAVFVVLAITDAGVVHLLYDQYQGRLNVTYKDNIRMMGISSSLLGVLLTDLGRYNFLTAEVYDRTRAQFRDSLDELTAIQDDLYRNSAASSVEAEQFTLRSVRDNDTHSYSVSSWSAIYQFIAKCNLVYNNPVDVSHSTQHAIAFLHLNGLQPILMPMASGAAEAMSDNAMALLRTIQWLALGLLVAKLLPLMFTLTFGYVPTMRVIEYEKGRVLRLFIEIPRAVVRAVLNKHRHNLAKADGGEESDSVSEEEEDVDALDTAVRSLDESRSAASERTGPSADGAHRPVGSGEIELHPSALKAHAGGAGEKDKGGSHNVGGGSSRFKGRRRGEKGKRAGRRDQLRRNAAGRAFHHSRNAFWSSLMRFSVLWVGIAAYFAASFAILWSVTDWSVVRVSNVEAASRRAAFLPYVQLISMYHVILPDAQGKGGLHSTDTHSNFTLSTEERVANREADFTSRAAIAPVLEGALTELVALDEALVYGSTARQTAGLREDGSSDRQIVLSLEDTCVVFAGELRDNCTKEEHGVLTHGLQNAIRTYTETVREMGFERSHLGVAKTLHTDAALLAERLEAIYLRPAARESLEIYTSDAHALVSEVITGVWVEAVTFFAIAFLVHFFLFRTMLSRLDLELRETRAMLLLVPPDVAQRVPAIRAFMTKLVEDIP